MTFRRWARKRCVGWGIDASEWMHHRDYWQLLTASDPYGAKRQLTFSGLARTPDAWRRSGSSCEIHC
jgi:hypothetical protein